MPQEPHQMNVANMVEETFDVCLHHPLRTLPGHDLRHSPQRIMSTPVISAQVDMPLTDAFLIFSEHGINHLPITEADGRLIGIVTRLDLLSALYGDQVDQRAL